MNLLLVLKKPLITEKNYSLVAQEKYVFVIDSRANKTDVKLAFEMIFTAKVKDVNVVHVKTKPRRIGRFAGRTKSFKKAIITLMPGQNLNLLGDNQETDQTKKKSIFTKFREQFINVNVNAKK